MQGFVSLPNALTVLRLVLTPFIVRNLLAGDCRGALGLIFVAGCTDALDGFLARHFNWRTTAGEYLDPIADKLLLTSIYLALGWTALIPAWLTWLVIGRDALILLMTAIALAFTRYRRFPPSRLGKLSTLLQIVLALAMVMDCTWLAVLTPTARIALQWTTGAVTLCSGIGYVVYALQSLLLPKK